MSGDDWDIFREARVERQRARNRRLEEANTEGWSRFSPHHFYRDLDGHRIEWWPSSNKWLYKGKYYRGALPKALKEKLK